MSEIDDAANAVTRARAALVLAATNGDPRSIDIALGAYLMSWGAFFQGLAESRGQQ